MREEGLPHRRDQPRRDFTEVSRRGSSPELLRARARVEVDEGLRNWEDEDTVRDIYNWRPEPPLQNLRPSVVGRSTFADTITIVGIVGTWQTFSARNSGREQETERFEEGKMPKMAKSSKSISFVNKDVGQKFSSDQIACL